MLALIVIVCLTNMNDTYQFLGTALGRSNARTHVKRRRPWTQNAAEGFSVACGTLHNFNDWV